MTPSILMKICIKIFILLFIILPLYSQEQIPVTQVKIWDSVKNDKLSEYETANKKMIDSLYNLYQNKVSDKSIHRCPFYTSCSKYYLIASKEYGFFLGQYNFY